MVLYLCVLIVFSLHRESFKLILVDEPLPEVILSQFSRMPKHIETEDLIEDSGKGEEMPKATKSLSEEMPKAAKHPSPRPSEEDMEVANNDRPRVGSPPPSPRVEYSATTIGSQEEDDSARSVAGEIPRPPPKAPSPWFKIRTLLRLCATWASI
jgi:hypothetical protein